MKILDKITSLGVKKIIGIILVLLGICLGINLIFIRSESPEIREKKKVAIKQKTESPAKQLPEVIAKKAEKVMEMAEKEKVPPPMEKGEVKPPFNEVYFLDDKVGFIAGEYLYRTANGGRSWLPVLSDRRYGILSLKFVGDTSWATGFGGMLTSDDRGTSWRMVESIKDFVAVFHAVCPVGDKVYITGDRGIIAVSSDRGQSWEKLLEKGNGWVFEDIHFTNPQTGFVCGYKDDGTGKRIGVILRTSDRGKNWDEVLVVSEKGDDFLTDLAFSDENIGFCTGMGGQIFKTTDGGLNWNNVLPPTTAFLLLRIFILDEKNIWVCGHNVVLKSEDGGGSFTTVELPGAGFLRGIYFMDKNNGWAVGDGGLVLQSNDGGKSFTRMEIL